MFENLGRVLVRYRKAAVALFVVGILVAGAVGSLIFSRLDSGGYSDPNSDSYKVYEYLRDDLKVEDPAVVVVIDAGDRDVTEPDVAQQALALEQLMAQEKGVTRTLSFWGAGSDANLKSADGKAAYILIFGSGKPSRRRVKDLENFSRKNMMEIFQGCDFTLAVLQLLDMQ